ncbi:MAG: alpha/beta hydrolase [Roseobacter sp.]|jgi:lysophospholipase
MTLRPAPFLDKADHRPAGGAAYWVQTTDGIRIRVGHWPVDRAQGTVLIFPGRTEYIEKYSQIATEFAGRGLASLALDWRGQGLSERLLDNPLIGHVTRFSDYQRDVAALLLAAAELGSPRPYFLLAHSMGGAIGLRALFEGLAVPAATFSGPMWGINIAARQKPAAWVLSHTMPLFGQGHRLPPGARLDHHVLTDGFEGNLLTRDREQFERMRQQLVTHPELVLGGPSYVWLREALLETRRLAGQTSPELPSITFLGSNERIVDIPAIHNRMSRWQRGRIEIIPEGEHEVLMESADVTAPLFDAMTGLFLD